ncbi:DUF885 domain-containing protein [Lysobacter gummosus]|uniref:DUF885 domain-containing protein n=1 Tax=Lysobacter gummosus TaxID=262324 RepID=A0ABY3XCI6_9GAMM|nr:DUF885 domain-containing protein [Lysobacter gummosus]ALN93975.1 hypothetical protein LG3211_5042 [Lysobacter gummosus]UNP29415.1 DUF885 domain-containing protein [Lysobacter gummosus]
MKPLVLAVALALSAPALLAYAPAAAAQTAPAAKPAAAKAVPAWVAKSDEYTRILIKAQADFAPEGFSFFGIPGYDDKVTDLKPEVGQRFRAAMAKAKTELQDKLASERDADVRQDLQILIGSIDNTVEGSELNEKLMLPWFDAPQTVFSGLNGLLSDQTPPERRALALARLQAYVGQAPGSTPLTQLARERYEERLSDRALLQPTKLEVEQALANVGTYVEGIRKLFKKYDIQGAEPALKAMQTQLTDYGKWTRAKVLPKARTDARLPPELYAYQLKQFGIDVDPQLLIRRAQVEFMETRAAMRQLAPQVAQAKGLKVADPHDYVAVIRALKRDTIANDQLESRYRKVIDAIDPIIRAERIVDVPQRPLVMRLGSDAESAAQPAPHFLPAPLVGNTGQQGQFVLPVAVPNAGGKALHYDDFNYESAAWTLSAHEGRPGHELQFTAMVERGISLARSMFAFNSVNVEGWALYAEAEMVPYEPLDGQLIALQFRLLRAARAILDPMLNLGLTDRASAGKVLTEQVGFSEAMTKQELDRYMFNAPGQAGSYFYGYSRILELRMDTELALGDRFDRLSFNNFLLDQGLLPPALLGKAVREDYVPKLKGAEKGKGKGKSKSKSKNK